MDPHPALSFSGNESSYTIEVWVRLRAKGVTGTLVAKVDRGVGAEYAIEVVDSKLRVFRNNEPYLMSGVNKLKAQMWHHVALTFNQLWVRLYLDGKEEASSPWGPHPSALDTPLIIGAVLDAGAPVEHLDGDIHEVRVWARSLSADRIAKDMFHRPHPDLLEDLVARFRVSPSSGRFVDTTGTIPDSSCHLEQDAVIGSAQFRAAFSFSHRAASRAARKAADATENGGHDSASASSSSSLAAAANGETPPSGPETMYSAAQRERWYIGPDDVTVGELLGKGAFGAVYAGEWRSGPVAVKRLLDAELDSKEQLETFRKEISLVASLRPSPYVVQFLGACVHPEAHFIVLELMTNRSVDYWIKNEDFVFPERERVKMALDAARGMHHIHAEGIIHADLATRNLLVDENWRVKVTDFGLSRVRTATLNEVSQAVGTPATMSPELVQGNAISTKTDVYSFAVVLWQMYTREDPFPGLTPMQIAWQVVMQGTRPPIPEGTPPRLESLLRRGWTITPEDRPSFEDVVAELVVLVGEM